MYPYEFCSVLFQASMSSYVSMSCCTMHYQSSVRMSEDVIASVHAPAEFPGTTVAFGKTGGSRSQHAPCIIVRANDVDRHQRAQPATRVLAG